MVVWLTYGAIFNVVCVNFVGWLLYGASLGPEKPVVTLFHEKIL
jgi:hypothetical protein